MWEYNYSDRNDWLEHGLLGSARANHKYIKRNFINGKWVYEYADKANNAMTGLLSTKQKMAVNRARNNDPRLAKSQKAISTGAKKVTPDGTNGEWSKKHQAEQAKKFDPNKKMVSKRKPIATQTTTVSVNGKKVSETTKETETSKKINKALDKAEIKKNHIKADVKNAVKAVKNDAKDVKTNAKIAKTNLGIAKKNLGIDVENAVVKGATKVGNKLAAKEMAKQYGGTQKEWEDYANRNNKPELEKKKKYKKFK